MELTVRTVGLEDGALVKCDSGAGPLVVRWRGSHLPAPGSLVDVELDVSDVLEWGVSLALLDGTPPRDEHGVPAGAVEAIDDDVVTVRIAGRIVLLEVVGEPPPTVIGRNVVIRGVPLEAWPTQI